MWEGPICRPRLSIALRIMNKWLSDLLFRPSQLQTTISLVNSVPAIKASFNVSKMPLFSPQLLPLYSLEKIHRIDLSNSLTGSIYLILPLIFLVIFSSSSKVSQWMCPSACDFSFQAVLIRDLCLLTIFQNFCDIL